MKQLIFEYQVAEALRKNQVLIQSGEGEVGTYERYKGKPSIRGLKLRLTRERSGGRQAFAWVLRYPTCPGEYDRVASDFSGFDDVATIPASVILQPLLPT